MKLLTSLAMVLTLEPMLCSASSAGDLASMPVGDPAADSAAPDSVALTWIIRGDANRNAQVELSFRKSGSADWKTGTPLFRVEQGPHLGGEFGSPLTKQVPLDGWLFAGSQMGLDPGTSYDVRLRLSDPDGGAAEKTLTLRTLEEPCVAPGAPVFHVAPGDGGGDGSPQNPWKGLEEADLHAHPGDVFKIHAGLYRPAFSVRASGEPGRPIVWQNAGDGDVLVGGAGPGPLGIRADGVHDVWFLGLLIRRKDVSFSGQGSARLRIAGCIFEEVRSGIQADRNDKGALRDWWITDNRMEGVAGWAPAEPDPASRRTWGIRISGSGHQVRHNRIAGFHVGIGTCPGVHAAAFDLVRNDLSETSVAGILLDGAERNVRCSENRIVNAGDGIVSRCILGGPVYLVRNVLVNIPREPFRMDARPSGVLVWQNTSVRRGTALPLTTESSLRNCHFLNNLFVGTSGEAAIQIRGVLENCDLDQDGIAGGAWKEFLVQDNDRYPTAAEVRGKAPLYRHLVPLDRSGLFLEDVALPDDPSYPIDRRLDLRLAADSKAIGAGIPIAGLSEGKKKSGPDLGAVALESPLPDYGVRTAPR